MPCSPLLGRQVVFNANGQHKSTLVILSNSTYFSLRKYDCAKIPLHLANTIPKLLLSGDFPLGIEGKASHRGKCRGEGRGWGAYHYLVFEELLQDLMLCTCGVTGLGKTLYRYHACCDAGPAAAVFTVQGSSQQCRSSGKALSLYIPHTHLTRKIFPLSQSMSHSLNDCISTTVMAPSSVTQLTIICLVDPYLMFIKPTMQKQDGKGKGIFHLLGGPRSATTP